MATKLLDSRGRLTLGKDFANKTVLVEEVKAGSYIVTLAAAIPERELWLFKNEMALASVKAGISDAVNGRLEEPLDMDEIKQWADQLADDEY
ncbi:MAG: hypothetical protein GC159_02065 [Phycisphaera sp.]|nr:hypothetical protein [Phycisphaera sp.]